MSTSKFSTKFVPFLFFFQFRAFFNLIKSIFCGPSLEKVHLLLLPFFIAWPTSCICYTFNREEKKQKNDTIFKRNKPSKLGQNLLMVLITSPSTNWQQLSLKHKRLLPHFRRNLWKETQLSFLKGTFISIILYSTRLLTLIHWKIIAT